MKHLVITGFLFILCVVFSSCNNNLANNKITEAPELQNNNNVLSSSFQPQLPSSFDIQFIEEIDVNSFESEVIDLDLFETSEITIEQLHRKNKIVICYFSAGSWEKWREDANNFPTEIIGKNYIGWPGEKWLDIRSIDKLTPILRSRFDLCKQKGFDGAETDNVDGYQNNTGFPLTAEDQLKFNRWLSEQAHLRGLSIGLKNDPEQIVDLVTDFDWLLLEDCYSQDWCHLGKPFIELNKPVFTIEYTDQKIDFDSACVSAKKIGINVILKNRNLDSYSKTCE
jgi:endo-alpha-1,4-polygalactosaminidase (GH114 family)